MCVDHDTIGPLMYIKERIEEPFFTINLFNPYTSLIVNSKRVNSFDSFLGIFVKEESRCILRMGKKIPIFLLENLHVFSSNYHCNIVTESLGEMFNPDPYKEGLIIYGLLDN